MDKILTLTFDHENETASITIRMEALEQYFHVVSLNLYVHVVRLIMLHKEVLTFNPLEPLKAIEQYFYVLSMLYKVALYLT